jgi:biopolymer transport protein ExbD
MNLFIFFIITFSFLATFNKQKESRAQVELPPAARSENEKMETLAVTMPATGELLLDEQPLSLEELRLRLRAAKDEGSKLAVVLRADAAVTHGRVVEVLEAARSEGIENLSIATRDRQSPLPNEGP